MKGNLLFHSCVLMNNLYFLSISVLSLFVLFLVVGIITVFRWYYNRITKCIICSGTDGKQNSRPTRLRQFACLLYIRIFEVIIYVKIYLIPSSLYGSHVESVKEWHFIFHKTPVTRNSLELKVWMFVVAWHGC